MVEVAFGRGAAVQQDRDALSLLATWETTIGPRGCRWLRSLDAMDAFEVGRRAHSARQARGEVKWQYRSLTCSQLAAARGHLLSTRCATSTLLCNGVEAM